MKMSIFAVHDAKAMSFRFPHFIQSEGQAVRSFQESANDPQIEIGKYPEDFTLWKIAEVDLPSGAVTPVIPMVSYGQASNYVKRVIPDA